MNNKYFFLSQLLIIKTLGICRAIIGVLFQDIIARGFWGTTGQARQSVDQFQPKTQRSQNPAIDPSGPVNAA